MVGLFAGSHDGGSRMKVLDLGIVIPLFREWNYAKTVIQNSKVRGEIVQKAIRILGLSKPRIYDIFNRLEKGEAVVSVSKVKRKKTGSRLGSLEKDLRDKEGFILSELMYAGEVLHEQKKKMKTEGNAKTVGYALSRDYGKSQEFAIELGEKLGKIRVGVWDRHKLGRWLRDKGLARRQVKQPLASITWSEPYANRAWMIDASPLNAVYLHPSKKYLAVRPDLEAGLTRIYEGSEDSQLRKIHIYVAVDVHSKAFFCVCVCTERDRKRFNSWRRKFNRLGGLLFKSRPSKRRRLHSDARNSRDTLHRRPLRIQNTRSVFSSIGYQMDSPLSRTLQG